jgi:hypothetical protein
MLALRSHLAGIGGKLGSTEVMGSGKGLWEMHCLLPFFCGCFPLFFYGGLFSRFISIKFFSGEILRLWR